jgi:hypothetical protein
MLYQAVRFYPKKFRQRQPKTGGDWEWNLKGVRRVPYNLPAVLKAIQKRKPIFLVEGEKDATALNKRGLCATTAPMGAGKWNSDYNDYFTGAELIITPDNDWPGKKHAAVVAGQLISKVKLLRILQLPGLEAKQDVSDWLEKGGTIQQLLELAFDSDSVTSKTDAEVYLGIDRETGGGNQRNMKELFFEEGLKIYSNDDEERVVADFNIDIKSIVKDDREGQIFYVKIKEFDRGRKRTSETIEIKPEYLDDLRSFYKAIRPYSMGEILQYRRYKTKPLRIFKWLLQNFDKPIVRRPDHVGFTRFGDRPFWIFGNAVVCPPSGKHAGKIVKPNQGNEFIVNNRLGFTLPLYDSEAEKEQLAPEINTNLSNIESFMGEVKTKIIQLIGGGDPSGRSKNYGKLLLGYVIYHLYEQQLYYSNDINGHTVMFYVHGPKGTGKTTYFNTVLRAFFGLHKTKQIKGNTVTIPGIENTMSMYSQLPVCYDEFNPEAAKINYPDINSYYHKTARSVNDNDRKNRNKFTHIRSTFSITSNYRINMDVDQADATESRAIYFQYKKEYRSEDAELFNWLEKHLNQLSAVTVHLLLNQTDEKRNELKTKASKLFSAQKKALEARFQNYPKKYAPEHRLTDNYTRLLACYELIFGEDEKFRKFIRDELLQRFAAAKAGRKENVLLGQLSFLASSGRLKECWHYHYNNNQKKLYVDMNQCYQSYEKFKRDKAISLSQFREILKDYFDDCGGFVIGSPRWYGHYFDVDRNKVQVNKTQHSYIISYSQLNRPDNVLKGIFPPKDEHHEVLRRMKKTENKSTPENLKDEAPF